MPALIVHTGPNSARATLYVVVNTGLWPSCSIG